MAAYVPAQLIAGIAMGNGAANIATWRRRNVAGGGTFDIHRTLIVVTPTAARTVTIEEGSVAADTVAQKILDAEALTANVHLLRNWWIAVPNNDYFEGFANAADINAASSGYTYS